MKNYLLWIMLATAVIVHYNAFLANRDKKMFEAYDQACAALPQLHPDCRYSK